MLARVVCGFVYVLFSTELAWLLSAHGLGGKVWAAGVETRGH